MNTTDRLPDEGEVFNTFHDMVQAAILCARTGTATLKEIYAACVRFGRVKCRKTGGWRLVTERRNWKSHVRHTLYTTEKFLRCPHDSESWMLSPEFCYTLPQTTRQFSGLAPPEDNCDELPRRGSARGRVKAAQRTQPVRISSCQAGLRANRSLSGSAAAPARRRPAGSRSQRLHAGADSNGELDTDSNDWEDDDAHEEEELPQVEEDDDQELRLAEEHEQRRPQRAWGVHTAGGAGARSDVRAATAQAYGVGSRNGRAQALLGVTAAAAAAAAATGDNDDLDLNDDETRTALYAAQEVLNNPAAARILLRLMQQQGGSQQQQHQQERSQQEGLRLHATEMQDPVRACRPRRTLRSELVADTDDEGEELEAEEREAAQHASLGGRAESGRMWQGEAAAGSSGARHPSSLNEGRDPRQLAVQLPHSTAHAHLSVRAAPRLTSGDGVGVGGRGGSGGGRGYGSHRVMAPYSSATGVAGRVGGAATAAIGSRQTGMVGRLDGLGGCGDGHGVGRRTARAADVDAAWEEDEGVEHGGWSHQALDVDDEDWEAEEGLKTARRYGGAAARTQHAGFERGWRGGKAGSAKPPPPAVAMAGSTAHGRRGGSPLRSRGALRHTQQLMPSASHINAATTAAAVAAAGEALPRLAGHHGPVLGKRSWVESNGGGFGADPTGEETEHLQHLHYQAAMRAAAYPPPLALRRLAEDLQAYHSRSSAAAAAAAAAVASAANAQQPRSYHGHIMC